MGVTYNKYVTLYFIMSCWEKCASLLLNFLFLLLVFNSLVHVANRPDYHVNLMLTYRFLFDNLRPQSYLKASVFFLGEAILTKAWTEGPRVAKVYIFVENRITYERAWIAQRSRNTTGCPRSSCPFNIIKYFILVVPSFDSNIRFVYFTSSAQIAPVFFPATFCFFNL